MFLKIVMIGNVFVIRLAINECKIYQFWICLFKNTKMLSVPIWRLAVKETISWEELRLLLYSRFKVSQRLPILVPLIQSSCFVQCIKIYFI